MFILQMDKAHAFISTKLVLDYIIKYNWYWLLGITSIREQLPGSFQEKFIWSGKHGSTQMLKCM